VADATSGQALATIERCLDEEPTLPDVYTVQSRIAKHAGDLEAAVAAACKAESLDLADRWAPAGVPIGDRKSWMHG